MLHCSDVTVLVKPGLLVPHHSAVSGSHMLPSQGLPEVKQTPGSCILPLWLQPRGAGPLFRTFICV